MAGLAPAPTPFDRINGIMPATNAKVSIRRVRNRTQLPRMTASRGEERDARPRPPKLARRAGERTAMPRSGIQMLELAQNRTLPRRLRRAGQQIRDDRHLPLT